ncbi:MAG: carboxypeptidase regulatory-like domain-containing protein [Bacteroidales bacterium]|nr:carboxypeptidase regulatory-like domain-containing protein [Bacteroidales bacterium]
MKRFLFSVALLAMALGVNAQRSVKTVVSPEGTQVVSSTEVTPAKSNLPTRGNAEIIWEKHEEYGIGINAFISEESKNAYIRWETNDPRIDAIATNGNVEWNFPTLSDWPSMSANKSGSLIAVMEDSFIVMLDAQGNELNTIFISGIIGAVKVNNAGTGVYAIYNAGASDYVAYYKTDSASPEWATELPAGLVGINVSDDESKIIVTCAGTNTLYVLEPEVGDVIQDDIYYYQNSPTQAPGMSADGTYIAWGDFDGKGHLYKWNGEQYEEVWKATLTQSGQSSCWGEGCAVSADGSTIAIGTLGFVSNGYDGYVMVFNNYSETPLWIAQTGGPVSYLDLSADGSLIAAASDGPMNHSTNDMLIYRRESSEVFLGVNSPGSIHGIDITDDGSLCVAAGKAVHSYEMGWGGVAYMIHSIPTTAGYLSGTITLNEMTDYSDAIVTIEGIDNYYAYTNAEGNFTVKYIPEGTYTVTVEKTGFAPQTINNVVIEAGETASIEATLEPVGSPIKNLYATKGSSNVVELRWEAFEDSFEGYNIYRKDNINGTFGEAIATLGTDVTTYEDATAVPTKNYFYAVTALLPDNVETPYSNIEEGYTSTGFLTDVAEVFNGAAPTIDGTLSEDEWVDAFKVDVSDFSGISEGIDPVGTVYLYLKTEGNKMYIGLEDFADTELSENDCLALYFDDNNDHVYPAENDNSEGNYWFKYSGGTGILQYRPIYASGSVGDVITVDGAEVEFSDAAGYVTMECVLEFGDEDYQITPSDNNESSVYLFYRSSGSEYHAYWPYDNIDTFNPIAYDTFRYFVDDETPEAPQNLYVDEELLGARNYVPVRWDMPEINDFSHFNVYVNSDEATHVVVGNEVTIDVESNTDYSVYVTTVDNNGNESEKSETLTFHVGVINVEETAAVSFSIYPNPASSEVYFQTEMNGEAMVSIVDMTGRMIKRVNISDIQNASVNVEDLSHGLYFFMIQQNDLIVVRKISVK